LVAGTLKGRMGRARLTSTLVALEFGFRGLIHAEGLKGRWSAELAPARAILEMGVRAVGGLGTGRAESPSLGLGRVPGIGPPPPVEGVRVVEAGLAGRAVAEADTLGCGSLMSGDEEGEVRVRIGAPWLLGLAGGVLVEAVPLGGLLRGWGAMAADIGRKRRARSVGFGPGPLRQLESSPPGGAFGTTIC
jgi:hypothetical protein